MGNTILVYTFRTFPFIENLNHRFDSVSILHKLKNDLAEFCDLVQQKKPSQIIGIAKSWSDKSYFEPLAINRFNKSKKVIRHTNNKYDLFLPPGFKDKFFISQKPSDSFCNYSMYFLAISNLRTRLSFAHISEKDISNLKTLFPNSPQKETSSN